VIDASTAGIESVSALSPHQRWMDEIDNAEKETKGFRMRARNVVKRFLDERDTISAGNKWFNLFYANTNIMESALYAQLPKPSVTRRFKDYQDDVARVAALIIQRSIVQDLDDPRDTFDATMRSCVQDRLVPGLAQAWLRLETDTEDLTDIPPQPGMETESLDDSLEDLDEMEGAGEPLKKVIDQRVCVDYVFWEDFLMSPCRVWEERRWVGRRVYMDRDELIKRFGEEKGKRIPLDYSPTHSGQSAPGSTPQHQAIKKACIYELWERATRRVFWVSKGMDTILDEQDDPLQLVGFEPCPRPMLANISTSNVTPRPDYFMVQDQYTELDTVNNRIAMLVQACKVVGVYDQSATGISRMLTEGFDNQLIPVDNWAAFAEKGGVKGAIDWLPLEVVTAALIQLNDARERIKGQIYELTGISDIVRGATKASETLGAQEIKSKFASIAIKKRQDEVARFAADILRIKAEIMINHFDPDILLTKSNILGTGEENAKFVPQAMQMLQTEEGFEWRIQITAESIAQADYAMEKADRIEMLTAVSGYIGKTLPMVAQFPNSATLMVSLLKWAVAGFRNAGEVEGILDQELDKLQTEAMKPKPPPPPSPEQQKVQADIQIAQQKAQLDAQGRQQELQIKEREAAIELHMKQMELQFKIKELELKERELMMEMKFAEAEAARNERTAVMTQQMELESEAQRHAQERQFSAENHKASMAQKAEASSKEAK